MKKIDLKSILELISLDMVYVEESLSLPILSEVDILNDILRENVLFRGKRVRPMLIVLIANMFGYEGKLLHPIAAAFEHVHAASLLHDDVIDDAFSRRGKLSANRTFGNPVAVLAGDYLYTKSFVSVLDIEDQSVSIPIITLLTKTVSEMSEAEILQLSLISNFNSGLKDYYKIIYGKTVALFSAACKSAAILSKTDVRDAEIIYNYGYNMGFSYQLIDDILDYFGDESLLGKKPGIDLKEGKLTLPVYLLIDNMGIENVKEIFLDNIPAEDKLQHILHYMDKYDIRKKSFDIAVKFIDKSKELLSHMPCNIYRDSLEHLTEILKDRTY